jgi:hypothetical protein
MKELETLFWDEFHIYRYQPGDPWHISVDNAEVQTFKPLYLAFSCKRDDGTRRVRVYLDCIRGSPTYALCIRNFWIEPLSRCIRADDITQLFTSGGLFGRSGLIDRGSNAGLIEAD